MFLVGTILLLFVETQNQRASSWSSWSPTKNTIHTKSAMVPYSRVRHRQRQFCTLISIKDLSLTIAWQLVDRPYGYPSVTRHELFKHYKNGVLFYFKTLSKFTRSVTAAVGIHYHYGYLHRRKNRSCRSYLCTIFGTKLYHALLK